MDRRRRTRAGFTLIELVLSLVMMSILLAGMTSVVLMASHALPSSDSAAARASNAMAAVEQIAADVFLATTLIDAKPGEVEFVVPDRGHGSAGSETMRYSWSGGGDPLTLIYNGGASVTVCEDAHDFAIEYVSTSRPLQAAPRVLYVVGNAAGPRADEIDRKTLMEAWGCSVEIILDDAPDPAFQAAAVGKDVAYISMHAYDTTVPGTLDKYGLPIVNEQKGVFEQVGMSKSATFWGEDSIQIDDNAHEITRGFPLGDLVISSWQNLLVAWSFKAPGLHALATNGGNPSLSVIEAGGELYGGGTAARRRVCLPWAGKNDFDFSQVTPEGLTIMRRAIDWAAAPLGVETVRITLQIGADPSTRVETHVRLLNLPEPS